MRSGILSSLPLTGPSQIELASRKTERVVNLNFINRHCEFFD